MFVTDGQSPQRRSKASAGGKVRQILCNLCFFASDATFAQGTGFPRVVQLYSQFIVIYSISGLHENCLTFPRVHPGCRREHRHPHMLFRSL